VQTVQADETAHQSSSLNYVPISGLATTPRPGLGLLPPKQGPDPFAHRRGEPRSFAAFWVFYVFGIIATAFSGLGWFGLIAPDVYRPAARLLMVSLAIGLWIVWPLVRLSQEPPRRPIASMWADWFLVLAPVAGAIAPQALPWMAAWPLDACAGMLLWLALWGMIVAGMLAGVFGREQQGVSSGRGVVRAAVMLGFVVVALAGPGLMALQRGGEESSLQKVLMLTSPASGTWLLTQPKGWQGKTVEMDDLAWGTLGVLGAVAMGVWAWAVVRVRRGATERLAG